MMKSFMTVAGIGILSAVFQDILEGSGNIRGAKIVNMLTIILGYGIILGMLATLFSDNLLPLLNSFDDISIFRD